jgi:hypothetical protein
MMMDVGQSLKSGDTASRPKTASKRLFSDENSLDKKRIESENKQVRFESKTNFNEEHRAFWDVTWPSLVQDGWKLVCCR